MMAREYKIGGAAPVAGEDLTAPVHHVHGADLRLAPGYVHAAHPEHGEPVTILPGELMPDWMRAALAGGATLVVEGDGVFRLAGVKGGKR
jgi:hypothetical protein